MSDFKNIFIMPRHVISCWIFAVVFLMGCSSEPVKTRQQPEVKVKPQSLKKPAPVKSYGLADGQATQHLLRADTFNQAGDTQAAEKALDLINEAELSPDQRSKFNLLEGQILLSMGAAEQATQKLKTVRPALLATSDKINYYQSLAFANLLMGDVLQAVSARIRLGNLLHNPEQQQANIVAIVDMLSVLPEDTQDLQPEIAGELKGWMVLAKILKQRGQPGVDIDSQIRQWEYAFPGHAANAGFLQAYLAKPSADQPSVTTAPTGNMIAVFLPTSGPYAAAGKAIQEGLQAAYRLAASAAPQQAPLKFYDSAQDDITRLYQQAVSEGANQIIGPLAKEQIEALSSNADLSVPVLALNHVENLTRNNLYQFGLSPLDEADALATKAHHDGRQSALILVPNTTQGQRIGHYLTESWQSAGGIVAGIESYDPRQHDISAKFDQLIKSASYPSGEQPPRALLLSANDDAARELAPPLKYQQNIDLAVYAMPTIYSGHPNPTKDAELGLFSFCDVPWLFDGYYSGPLSQAALQNSWQNLPDSVTRLVALGIDAYNLLGKLDQLSSTPYAGATGQLSLNGENRITRKLVCAQFKGGVPVASGYVE
jgi:outer membrane PBP1 activator LpoA protein